MHGWAGRPRGRPLTFPRPSFLMMQFARTMIDWTSMPPPRVTMLKDFPDKLEAARQALSQTRGGFGALSGPGYKPTASALPRERPWNAHECQQLDPRKASKKQLAVATPSPLKQLPHDWIPLNERPKFARDIADLQGRVAAQNVHRCDRRRKLQWNWKLSSTWQSMRLRLKEMTDRHEKPVMLALPRLFRATMEKKMNPTAKKTVTKKMRKRARLRQWWKRKA